MEDYEETKTTLMTQIRQPEKTLSVSVIFSSSHRFFRPVLEFYFNI